MKVYALVSILSIYSDQCECWESIIDLYLNYDEALMNQIALEETNTDSRQSWTVIGMRVK